MLPKNRTVFGRFFISFDFVQAWGQMVVRKRKRLCLDCGAKPFCSLVLCFFQN